MALLSPSPAFIGHRHWVLSISWSPDGKKLASGCKNGQVGDIRIKGQRVASGTLKGVLGGSWEMFGGMGYRKLLYELLSFRFCCGIQARGCRWAGPSVATASGSQP